MLKESFLFFFRFPYPNDQTVYFEIVVSTLNPYYVAFDSENSHLYWTGLNLGKIMRCNPDGSDLSTIVDVSRPVALTLDTHNRFVMFFPPFVHFLLFNCHFLLLDNGSCIAFMLFLNYMYYTHDIILTSTVQIYLTWLPPSHF